MALREIVARNPQRRRRESKQRLEEAQRRLLHRRRVLALDRAMDPLDAAQIAAEIMIERIAWHEARPAFQGAVTPAQRIFSQALDEVERLRQRRDDERTERTRASHDVQQRRQAPGSSEAPRR